MRLDLINAIASLGTLAVLAATVSAAIVQLRHLRASNELDAVLAIERDFRSDDIQAALRYVQDQLPGNLGRAPYRAELVALGYVDPEAHPEIVLCDWFNRVGALVHGGFLDERLVLSTFGRLVDYYWTQLMPVIALMRRRRGRDHYRSFEHLAVRARRRRTLGGESVR